MTIPKCRPYVEPSNTVLSKQGIAELVAAARQERRLYRGCAWVSATGSGRLSLTAYALTRSTVLGYSINTAVFVGNARPLEITSWSAIATKLLLMIGYLSEFSALDHVPWEIHLIEDSAAYATALESYYRESRR